MHRLIRIVTGFVAVVIAVAAVLVSGLWIAFGRGQAYPDLSTSPALPTSALEIAVKSDRPIGNAAVSASGRIFYTIHPESQPKAPFLYEFVNGKPVPFPDEASQETLFKTPLGVVVDRQNRLWVIDPGMHGTSQPRLLGFDLASNKLVHRFDFPSAIAPLGSFLQDLQVDSLGETIYIADVAFWVKRPAIVVYDIKTKTARRVLEKHASVYPQNLLIRNPIRDMSFFGGVLQMKTGIDGVALSRDDQWLYYGAMNHDTLFRIPAKALKDGALNDEALAKTIEAIGKKPLNDGFSIDDQQGVFITDVEHQGVARMTPDGKLTTVIKDSRIRWADGLSFGPDGWLYLADSAIPHLVLQSPEDIAKQAPFYIWRFKPGTSGFAGQ